MVNRLTKKPPTARDQVDHVRLKLAGKPSHINVREDRLLKAKMPESHGRVVTRGLLAEAGRLGDDRVTLLTAREAALLKARGGSGTRNPATGLLEYGDGMGGSDNPGGGHNGDSGPGGTGGPSGPGHGGVSGDNGPSGPGHGGYGGDTSFGPARDVGYSWGNSPTGYRSPDNPYSGNVPSTESLLNTPNGYRAPGFENVTISPPGYAAPDTWERAWQEFWSPSLETPGRYGAPNKHGPGIFGSFLSQVTPALSLGPVGVPAFGVGMRVGGALGRASSPETQAAAAAEFSEQGKHNSGGSDPDNFTGLSQAELARIWGSPSGAMPGDVPTGLLDDIAMPGGAEEVDPKTGLVIARRMPAPLPTIMEDRSHVEPDKDDEKKLPKPVESLLMDYIFRGRQGSGWNW